MKKAIILLAAAMLIMTAIPLISADPASDPALQDPPEPIIAKKLTDPIQLAPGPLDFRPHGWHIYVNFDTYTTTFTNCCNRWKMIGHGYGDPGTEFYAYAEIVGTVQGLHFKNFHSYDTELGEDPPMLIEPFPMRFTVTRRERPGPIYCPFPERPGDMTTTQGSGAVIWAMPTGSTDSLDVQIHGPTAALVPVEISLEIDGLPADPGHIYIYLDGGLPVHPADSTFMLYIPAYWGPD